MKSTMPISRAMLLALASSMTSLHAGVIYSDNFESYAPGSILNGEGGWQLAGAPYDSISPLINVGVGLGTQVMDGRGGLVAGSQDAGSLLFRPLSLGLDPTKTTTLTFDAFAFSSGPKSHSLVLGLEANTSTQLGAISWQFTDYTASQHPSDGPMWVLVNPLGGRDIELPGGADRAVELGIIIDGPSNEYWGAYNLGSGAQETTHHAISDAQIAALDELFTYLYIPADGSSRGGELDNIVISNNSTDSNIPIVPESRSAGLLAAGSLAAIVGWSQRRRRHSGKGGPDRLAIDEMSPISPN